MLRSWGPIVELTSHKHDELDRLGVELHLGGDTSEVFGQASLVILSPGVALDAPMVQHAKQMGLPIVGELEMAAHLCASPIIAVTGTNGKSTTTALCAHLLQQAGLNAFMGGNIGRPFSELLLLKQQPDWAVVEVSSFQLEHLCEPDAFVPEIGIWLNLTPDHLDRHGSMEVYLATKRRLFEGQTPKQAGVFWADDPLVYQASQGLACQKYYFGRQAHRLDDQAVVLRSPGLRLSEGELVLRNPSLLGDHNAENAAAAVLAARRAGVAFPLLQAGLDSYQGLPHRIQQVGEVQGVRFINDSKGTNPDATAKSLTSFDGPVVLIAGGRGKGTQYDVLREPVRQRVTHLVLIGEDAKRIEQALSDCTEVHHASDMAQAVRLALSLAEVPGVVLLSPACASFDMFRDYAHRGEVFGEMVAALEESR